jgi:hypothetical protein
MTATTTTAKPTTTKVMTALGSVAQSTHTDHVSAAATAHNYFLTGQVCVTVVVSRRAGRIVRANVYTPDAGFTHIEGTATTIARELLTLAHLERVWLRG